MRKSHLLIISFCVLLTSCHSRIEHQLADIEALVSQQPDSALSALKRIDTLSIHRTKDKAYYALLLSAARDKCYIDVTNDSLITLSADYFANHGSLYNRMRSYYYQGIVRINKKEFPAAIVSLEKAEKDAKRLNDLRYLGLIYRNMASIFHATNNYSQAVDYTKAAISCFDNNKDSIYALYATYSLAVSYLNNAEGYINRNNIDSCLIYIKTLQANTPNETLLAYSNIRKAQALVVKGDSLQQAINLYLRAPKSLLVYRDYGYCAFAFAKNGQLDSAQQWMNAAFASAHTPSQKAVLNSLLFRVDSLEGRYPEALRKVTNAMAVQDSVTRMLLQLSLSIDQKDYYQHEATLKNNQIQRQRLVFSAIIIIALLTFLSLLLLMQNRKKLQENLLKEQMAQLAITRQIVRKENGTLVGALFMEKLVRLFGLSLQYYEAKDDAEKAESLQEFKNVARELENVPAFFDQLENNLNLYCSGIMDKLN